MIAVDRILEKRATISFLVTCNGKGAEGGKEKRECWMPPLWFFERFVCGSSEIRCSRIVIVCCHRHYNRERWICRSFFFLKSEYLRFYFSYSIGARCTMITRYISLITQYTSIYESRTTLFNSPLHMSIRWVNGCSFFHCTECHIFASIVSYPKNNAKFLTQLRNFDSSPKKTRIFHRTDKAVTPNLDLFAK